MAARRAGCTVQQMFCHARVLLSSSPGKGLVVIRFLYPGHYSTIRLAVSVRFELCSSFVAGRGRQGNFSQLSSKKQTAAVGWNTLYACSSLCALSRTDGLLRRCRKARIAVQKRRGALWIPCVFSENFSLRMSPKVRR